MVQNNKEITLDQITELEKQPYTLLDKATRTDFSFKLILVGDSAVGKSALMQRVTSNDFVEDHEVTVGVEFGSLVVQLQGD